MTRVGVIARLTFQEAVRKRLVAMAFLAGGGFLLLFGIAYYFQAVSLRTQDAPVFAQHQALNSFEIVGLYAVDFLIVAITVLTSVETLSGEIASGTIQAVATRPLFRWELYLGKWVGFCAVLTLFAAVMFGGITMESLVLGGTLPRHLTAGFGLMWLQSMLLLTVTVLFSTTCSTLTAGVSVLGLHGLAFLGGWIEQTGAFTRTPQAVLAGVVASVLMPSESLWRRAAFEMQSPIVTALNRTPFAGISVPSEAMVAYAVVYTVVLLGIGLWRFDSRDL